jgi:hypothetical protein
LVGWKGCASSKYRNDCQNCSYECHLLPYSKLGEPLAISLYRFCQGQQGKELLSHGVAAIIFVADDVESLISFTGFHYQEGSYGIEGESSTAATVPIILASKQLQNTFSKQGAYLKTNLKVENFDYPSVNVIAG